MSDLNHLRAAKLSVVIDRYLLSLQIDNQSPRTIETVGYQLAKFVHYCDERGVETIADITAELLAGYRRHLYHRQNDRTGTPLKPSTQAQYLVNVRAICKWLVKHKLLPVDPSTDLELPKLPRQQLSEFLTLEEINAILAVPDTTQPFGIRNRAILETLYSSAIRASELSTLSLHDIDRDRKLLVIRHGKGDKPRLSPISTTALAWIDRYINEVRAANVRPISGSYLFIGQRGRRISRNRLAQIVKAAREQAGISKDGACHLIRHTAATLMLEGGADLRSLQVFLGHESLQTTQRYTHVTLGHLREVHDRTHPDGDKRKDRNGNK